AGAQNPAVRNGFEMWLRQQLRDNTPYDDMARAILSPSGTGAFYAANENRPENLAAATTRTFLGVKLECAQCHRHPLAPWPREQFWSLAAFYATPPSRGRSLNTAKALKSLREIKIPNTEQVARARFLDDREPDGADDTDARLLLATWVTAPENPWFTRAAVN